MAKTFITSDYDCWLYDIYPNKSNKELAVQLTSIISKENRQQLERLYRMRPLITQTTLRQTLERQIAWRERFTKVTENMVKKAAMRLAGLRKSPLFLSSANRNKARTTNVRKWKQQAKPVDNADKWLRSFRCREVRICRLTMRVISVESAMPSTTSIVLKVCQGESPSVRSLSVRRISYGW